MLIDLANYRTTGSLVYAGRSRGQAVRLASGVQDADKHGTKVLIRVPEDTFTVTTSFFLGMFGDSIGLLGSEEFLARYTFTGKDISHVVRECVAEAVKTQSPLMSAR